MKTENEKAKKFIGILLNFQDIKNLEFCDDQGVKVSEHTYDVLNIAIKKIKKKYIYLDIAREFLNFFSITIGIIIHDVSKSSIKRLEENLSHSQMMLKNTDYIAQEVENILNIVEKESNFLLKDDIKKEIVHIVISHHGKWGKIQPTTDEAKIVYTADMESAKYHRINPLNANDILKLSSLGYNINEIEEVLGCSKQIIKDRINRAKKANSIKKFKDLLELYIKTGEVIIGDNFFKLRVKETIKLKKIVEEKGFYNLFMSNPLMEYMVDDEIFKKENENR